MAELRESLHALVEQPPARPAPIVEVAARGARFARRRRARRGAASLLLVTAVATAGLAVVQRSSRPEHLVADRAGVPVVYEDDTGDAVGEAPEVAAYDIVRVAWAPAAGTAGQRPRDYSISITIAGAADEEGSYIPTAELRSAIADETCQISHYLRPADGSFADVICGSISAGTRRFVGRVEGGSVTSTRTAGGGTTLTATFDASTLPREAAGQAFVELSAITACPEDEPGCGGIYRDEVHSELTYRP